MTSTLKFDSQNTHTYIYLHKYTQVDRYWYMYFFIYQHRKLSNHNGSSPDPLPCFGSPCGPLPATQATPATRLRPLRPCRARCGWWEASGWDPQGVPMVISHWCLSLYDSCINRNNMYSNIYIYIYVVNHWIIYVLLRTYIICRKWSAIAIHYQFYWKRTP